MNLADLVKWLREALFDAQRGPVEHRATIKTLVYDKRHRLDLVACCSQQLKRLLIAGNTCQ